MSTAPTRRVANSPTSPATRRNWLSEVSTSIVKRPSAMILYGVPGIGKTSFAAAMPGVCFMVDAAEQGINTLKEAGVVRADLPVLPPATSWSDTLGMLDALRTEEHTHKILAIDAIGGFERLCHEEVCRRDYSGEWGERGFGSYQRGFDTALADWRMFINALDALRDERSMSIVLLGHAKISPFKNPSGPDFDRYNVDVHHKTWALTHKWADIVLFANYELNFTAKEQNEKKAKAKGGKTRILYTEHEAAFDAKNRANLPPEIEMGSSGKEAWDNFRAAFQQSRP